MTTYDFTHKRGDTFNGVEFVLSSVTAFPTLADFPTTGEIGVIYKATDTGLLYKYTTEYVITTDIGYIDLTNSHLLCQFKQSPETISLLTLRDGSGLSIIDAEHGTFRIDNQVIDIDPAVYFYDIQITFQNATVKTYVSGKMTLTADISRG